MQPTNEDGSPATPLTLVQIANPLLDAIGMATYVDTTNTLRIIESREYGDWHMSVTVASEDRYPTWDELRDVCWALHPEHDFKVQIPKPDRPYLNTHPLCIHMVIDRNFLG